MLRFLVLTVRAAGAGDMARVDICLPWNDKKQQKKQEAWNCLDNDMNLSVSDRIMSQKGVLAFMKETRLVLTNLSGPSYAWPILPIIIADKIFLHIIIVINSYAQVIFEKSICLLVIITNSIFLHIIWLSLLSLNLSSRNSILISSSWSSMAISLSR